MNKTDAFEIDKYGLFLQKDLCEKQTPLAKRVEMVPLDLIESSSLSPRRHFDEVAIASLADSIRRHGLLQPILVRKLHKTFAHSQRYALVAGERRFRAFQMLLRKEIPSLILSVDISEADEMTLVENLVRKDLNMFEYAHALQVLLEKGGMTQEELANRLSTSQSNIANKIRLLKFKPEEQVYLLENDLTERHARALLRITDETLRKQTAELIVTRGLTVSRAERYIEILLAMKCNEKTIEVTADSVESFGKSLERSVLLLQKKGFCVRTERTESDEEVLYLIRIPKA